MVWWRTRSILWQRTKIQSTLWLNKLRLMCRGKGRGTGRRKASQCGIVCRARSFEKVDNFDVKIILLTKWSSCGNPRETFLVPTIFWKASLSKFGDFLSATCFNETCHRETPFENRTYAPMGKSCPQDLPGTHTSEVKEHCRHICCRLVTDTRWKSPEAKKLFKVPCIQLLIPLYTSF